MADPRAVSELVTCPECKGRGMIRPEGEWTNETCPICNGRGQVPKEFLTDRSSMAPDRGGSPG